MFDACIDSLENAGDVGVVDVDAFGQGNLEAIFGGRLEDLMLAASACRSLLPSAASPECLWTTSCMLAV